MIAIIILLGIGITLMVLIFILEVKADHNELADDDQIEPSETQVWKKYYPYSFWWY